MASTLTEATSIREDARDAHRVEELATGAADAVVNAGPTSLEEGSPGLHLRSEGRLPPAQDLLDDLRLRLAASQDQESAARTALRRTTRELAIMRRLAKFAREGADAAPSPPPGEIPRAEARLVLDAPAFHVDLCERRGTEIVITGWAFHPSPGWNGRDAQITVLLQAGATTYYAQTGKLMRPDVAAHFAAQSVEASGGARGLDGVGFGCEILLASLPPVEEWQLALRLECGLMVCEGRTAHRLRL